MVEVVRIDVFVFRLTPFLLGFLSHKKRQVGELTHIAMRRPDKVVAIPIVFPVVDTDVERYVGAVHKPGADGIGEEEAIGVVVVAGIEDEVYIGDGEQHLDDLDI